MVEMRWELEGGGTLTGREEGACVHLEAVRPLDEQGLYKVWLRGGRNGRCLLGTMVPEQGALRLRRTLSRQDLAQRGCWPLLSGESVLAFSFQERPRDRQSESWKPYGPKEKRLPDPVLSACLERGEPPLFRPREEGFQLAVPFAPSKPLTLAPLFCLGRVAKINGTPYILWDFDHAGTPVPPHNS